MNEYKDVNYVFANKPWELIKNFAIIFITRFEPSDYARKLMIRHNLARILSFQMSFATFVLEDCISVISAE